MPTMLISSFPRLLELEIKKGVTFFSFVVKHISWGSRVSLRPCEKTRKKQAEKRIQNMAVLDEAHTRPFSQACEIALYPPANSFSLYLF